MTAVVENRSVWWSLRVVLGLAGLVVMALQFFAFVDVVQTHTHRAKLQQGARAPIAAGLATAAWAPADAALHTAP